MKLLKRKNFQSLIYAIFISLPILSLIPNLLYFGFNEKAQDYTDVNVVESYEYETNEVNSVDDLIEGNIYKLTIPSKPSTGVAYITNTDMIRLYSGGLSVITAYEEELKMNYNSQYDRIYIYQGVSYTTLTVLNNDYITYPLTTYFVYFDNGIDVNQIDKISASDYLGEKSLEVIESEMNPQNAFEYTISKFIKDNNFGRIDFFSFFSSLFLGNATINAVYVGFVNWYLNYILYISLAYLLFSVLLWFVNFGRRLLEDSENINIGGF